MAYPNLLARSQSSEGGRYIVEIHGYLGAYFLLGSVLSLLYGFGRLERGGKHMKTSVKKLPRKFPRFKVEPSFPMSVFIPQSYSKNYKLNTFGEGGFGFYAPSRDASLVQHPNIDVRFDFGGRTLSFKAKVQYCTFLPKHGANYFGVKFEEVDSRQEILIKTIIQAAVKRGHLVDLSVTQSTGTS